MKKVIKKKKEQPSPLLDVAKSERITNQGTKTLRKDVNNTILPELRKYGYNGKLITSEEVERIRVITNPYYEEKMKIPPKDLLIHDTSGFFLKIWKQGRDTPFLIAKPFVRPAIKDVDNLPRLNLQAKLMDGLLTYAVPEARITVIVHGVAALNLHFLVMTETHQFWLGRYGDIPEEFYFLTWRKEKGVLDRIAVKNIAHESGQFHSTKTHLAEELKLYMFLKNSKI